ncbi:NADH:ubiquinone oxidoreductase intermediate-associated protein 30 [Xylaria sp. FL0933]|nr:NADH:ubiquinone oxidoreductase intermediate-associated protein 30 [Xylaria sp. FL0933]
MTTQPEPLVYLFGGNTSWNAKSWVVSDDRVRGGKSRSHLDLTSASGSGSGEEETVRFHGVLDITALGGAGFASQRSPPSCRWDLSSFHGLCVGVQEGDGMKYTLIVKDTAPTDRGDGRLESSVSWEYDFNSRGGAGLDEVRVRWGEFKPTYRGKPKPDAEPLKIADIRSVSVMVRSFFGQQEGPFNLELKYIAAFGSP